MRPINLKAQDGIALPVAIMVLFIIGALTAAAVTVSVQNNSSTQRDDNAKAALAAAEAGLQAADFRLDMLHPEESGKYCIGQSAVEVAGATGYCQAVTQETGNKAKYTYWTSEALSTTASCVGQAITSQEAISQRCLVAEGEAGGVRKRVSERVAAFTATPLFHIHGVTGLKKIVLSNNGHIKGGAGSNGKIYVENNAEVTEGAELGPSGETLVGKNGVIKGTVYKRTTSEGPLTLSSKEPGSSVKNCVIVEGKVVEGNYDCYITHYINYVKNKEAKPVEPYDQAEKVGFNEETRKLKMENNALLVLKEGTYNFCSFEAQNNATIEIAANAKVVIYIDSANDPNSKCPSSGSDVFKIWNNATIVNPSHNPAALQIYVYDGSGGTVYLKNNAELYAMLYAPFSKVNVENNGTVHGAIAGSEVELGNNMNFEWDDHQEPPQIGTVSSYYRSAWGECTPEHGSGSPETGC